MSRVVPVTVSVAQTTPKYIFNGPGTFHVVAEWPGGRGLFCSDLAGDDPNELSVDADSEDPTWALGLFQIKLLEYPFDPEHKNGPFQIDLPPCTITITFTMGSGKSAHANYFTFAPNE